MKKISSKKLDRLLLRTGDMSLKRRAKSVIEGLDLKTGDKILDLGCGDGFYLHLLSELGNYELTAIDNNSKAISLAKKYLGKARAKNIRFKKGDVCKLPFKDSSFDKMIASELLEHLDDESGALKEWLRVLKKGGVLVFTVPSSNYPFLWDPINWLLQHLFEKHIESGFWSGIWNEHERLYTPKELEKVVRGAGFEVEKLEPLTHYCLPFNHHILYLGYKMRMSSATSLKTKESMSKFSTKQKKDLFSQIFKFIDCFDRLNNKKFDRDTSAVGVFVKARK